MKPTSDDDTAPRRSRRLALTAATLALGLLVSACSDDADEPEGSTASESPTESPSESATTAAAGSDSPTLTSPGSQLAYGDTATVEYTSQDTTGTLDLTAKSATQGALSDFSGFDTQDSTVRNANFYYVRVQVENVGKKPFGNAEVPLWGISGKDTLLPPVKFTTPFETCPTENLPARFRPGDKFATCLVFLSPQKGDLVGVSYRPTVDFTPIEWRGKVEKAGGKKPEKGDDRQGGGNNDDN